MRPFEIFLLGAVNRLRLLWSSVFSYTARIDRSLLKGLDKALERALCLDSGPYGCESRAHPTQ
jgi:hypothetical protein